MFFTKRAEQANRIKELEQEISCLKDAAYIKEKADKQLLETVRLNDDKIKQLQERVDDLLAENSKLSKQVREQTEADILIVSLKLVGIIPSKQEKTELMQQYNALNDRLAGAQRAAGGSLYSTGQANIGNMFSGILGY